ncbi:MAG: hypothetical protein ACLSUG_13155 [Alistipes shahii]
MACQASPEEETAVLTWLEADPAHESELAKVQRQHDLVALSAPVINELYAKDRRRRFGSVLRRWSAAAAAVVLLAFGGYYFTPHAISRGRANGYCRYPYPTDSASA